VAAGESYLLLGPETGEKERFISQLRARIEGAAGEAPEVSTFYTFETQPHAVVALLRNGSLFSAHRIVMYKGIDTLTKKDDVEPVASYLSKPSPDTTLLLIAETPGVDKRIEKALPADRKKIFWELFENQKRSWVTGYFKQAGLSISTDAVELLLEVVDNTTDGLRKECEKLSQFFGEGGTVDEQGIETYIYHSKEENVFTLFDHVAGADLPASLETLQSILLSGDSNAVGLLSGLVWQFRRLLQVHSLLAESYAITDACTKAGIRSKRTQKSYAEAVRNFTARDVEAIMTLLAQFDGELRAARSDQQRLLLELFLYYCIARKGRAPEPYRA